MKKYSKFDVAFRNVQDPQIALPDVCPEIPNRVYIDHVMKTIERMRREKLDCLAIYADREHFGNFRYLTKFEPRFEEALLVLHADGQAYALLGNECANLYRLSPYPLTPVLCQPFSLPNQTMDAFESMERCLGEAGLKQGMRVGAVGWKLLKKAEGYSLPEFIVRALIGVVGSRENILDATAIFINEDDGLRIINTADEIAAYEYGAALAGADVRDAVNEMQVGMRECEVATRLVTQGRVLSCHPIVAFGKNAFTGLVSPTDQRLQYADAVSISVGLVGGLTCRGGYAVKDAKDLGAEGKIFFEDFARQYFAAAASWYESIAIGVKGGDLFALIEDIIPRSEYGWTLNPGHLIADEEWLCSPIYENSRATFKSGMLVQMDIIPNRDGIVSPNMEDGICIADEQLQAELRDRYPCVYARMVARREYMEKNLHISMKKEILPMSNYAAVYRPLMLDRERAFTIG